MRITQKKFKKVQEKKTIQDSVEFRPKEELQPKEESMFIETLVSVQTKNAKKMKPIQSIMQKTIETGKVSQRKAKVDTLVSASRDENQ